MPLYNKACPDEGSPIDIKSDRKSSKILKDVDRHTDFPIITAPEEDTTSLPTNSYWLLQQEAGRYIKPTGLYMSGC